MGCISFAAESPSTRTYWSDYVELKGHVDSTIGHVLSRPGGERDLTTCIFDGQINRALYEDSGAFRTGVASCIFEALGCSAKTPVSRTASVGSECIGTLSLHEDQRE